MGINWWTYQGYRWLHWSATLVWAFGRASCVRPRSNWWIRGRGGIIWVLGWWDCRWSRRGRGRWGSASRLCGCWVCRSGSLRMFTSLVTLRSSIRRPCALRSSSRCFAQPWCLKLSCPPSSSLFHNRRRCRSTPECCRDPLPTGRPHFPFWLWSCRGWSKWGSCYCWCRGLQWYWVMQFWVIFWGWEDRTCSEWGFLFGNCQLLLWSAPPNLASLLVSRYPTSTALPPYVRSEHPCWGLAYRWIDTSLRDLDRAATGEKRWVCLN